MSYLLTFATWSAAALGMLLLADGLKLIIERRTGKGVGELIRRVVKRRSSAPREERLVALAREEYRAITPVGRYLETLIGRADLDLRLWHLYGAMVLIGVLVFLLLKTQVPILGLTVDALIGLVTGPLIVVSYLRLRYRKRLAKFQELLPDTIDLIVRGLRIGHPLSTVLSSISKDMPDPVGREFGIAAHQVMYGMSVPEAIARMSQRIELNDLLFFSVSIQIHSESGGNLAEIMNSLSVVIRSRFQLMRKIKSLTAEGRFSAWFLSLYPVALIFLMEFMKPGYYESAMTNKYFNVMAATVFIMLILNGIITKMIINIRV